MQGSPDASSASDDLSSQPGADLVPAGNLKIAIPRLAAPSVKANQQRTARACVACRARKTKCDGRKPVCRQCRRLELVCNYAGSKRERQQLELESVRTKVASYESLLRDIVAESSRQGASAIGDLIDKHFQASPDVFASLLAARSLSDPQILPRPQPGISLHRMHLTLAAKTRSNSTNHSLADTPLVQVSNIQFWTDLVNNTTASHLLSLYFAWENPTWHLVDQEMFIRDLEAGRKKFCSSLLVHTLLFFGCVNATASSSYHLGRITDRREEKALGKRLYSALQHLWQSEKDDAGLPTAQSSIMIGLLCCTFGIDRLGTRYIMHGAQLSRDLGLHRESTPYFSSDVEADAGPMSRCHKFVACGIFDVQALAAQVYRKTPVWDQPPVASFSREEAAVLDEGDEWKPYPYLTPVFRPFFYTASHFRNGLVAIVNEIAGFALKFPDATLNLDDWEYGRRTYQRLREWRAGLPSVVLPDENTSPHILTLHMYYQATIVSLCEIFNLNIDPSNHPADPDFDTQAIKLRALDIIGSLILLFQTAHGLKSVPIVMLHYFCVGGVHAISQLRPLDMKWSLVLESCVVGLWHLSLGWGRLCTAFLRTIELVMKATKPDPTLVPPKVTAVLQLLSTNLWTATDVSSLAADYVVYHVPALAGHAGAQTGSEFRAQGLESLIRTMDNFSIS
ncbi:putative C6 transcription factor [Aspergillus ibericus CBS 121593]|uniref:C6 transcription factor n=1 Tax=Aspergillus ibericus CBS 121593 TaxID=1448316 RepID=A0A395HED3_9EURO|nr:C6 transcription factor [Aspergillus ibericus CBS 121593]RAL06100.1 C6 transcription factor [Aspergillus ibericus CBS 121593]